ncbi:hypothetical protein MBLNU459_g6996t1 [Dothideomycetes sp. NU459]
MASTTIPRFLLPRGQLYLRDARLSRFLASPALRHASSSSSSSSSRSARAPAAPKMRVLEKPTRFNPPSHPARKPRAPRAYPGPALSEHEKQTQKTKQYPHMMPPEGTFLHWFLTNRSIHVWITISILCSLAFFTWLTNFLSATPYRDQLPPNNFFFSHPFQFLRRYVEVYKLHTEYLSMQTAEHRRQKVEDVRKRAEYRKAHGLDKQGMFGWDVKEDDQVLGPAVREGGVDALGEVAREQVKLEEQAADGEGYTDFEGKRRPLKKWLGIW